MKKILYLTLTLFLASTTAALAQDSSLTSDQLKTAQVAAHQKRTQAQDRLAKKRVELEQKKADLRASAEAKKDESCQRRLAKLDNRITNADSRKKGLMTHYQKAAEHMQRLIDRGAAAEVDVTEMTANLIEYKTKVDGLAADFDAFTEVIAQAQSLDCEQPKEQLRTLHSQIKTAHQKILTTRKEIHNYYKETIRPDAVTIIKATAAAKEGEGSEADSGTESNTGGEE